jgi:class 3 adenylate cyclase
MDPVPTQYVDRDGAALAYQVIGDGPVDVLYFQEISLHLDLFWTDPDMHHALERDTLYARAIHFQRRGFGLSDQIGYVPTVEQQADDVRAIMDAVGVQRATLFGMYGTSAPMAMVAAQSPERVNGLVLFSPFALGVKALEELHGWERADIQNAIDRLRFAYASWGSGRMVEFADPVLDTPFNVRLMALLERSSATPSAARSYFESLLEMDVRDVLRSVQVPTRVVWPPTALLPEAYGRYMAELIPTATFHLLRRTPAGASLGQSLVPTMEHIEEVATGRRHHADADRFLGTALFTDVVSSTELLATVGDAKYQDMRAAHERLVRVTTEESGGRLLSVMGDGTLSVFDGPTTAVRCAESICRDAQANGMPVRCGVHTGEMQRDGMNVTGMTVHIGARVGSAAGPGEVLVSRTVHDLVVGSGLTFASRGEHELKGVQGAWELFALTDAGAQPEDLPEESSMQTPVDKMVLQTARTAPAFVRAAVRLGNAIERRRARAG